MFQVQWKMGWDNRLLKVLSSSKEVLGKRYRPLDTQTYSAKFYAVFSS